VGVRLSPANRHGNIEDVDRWGTWSYLVAQLATFRLAYIHLVEPRVDDSQDIANPDLRLASACFRELIDAPTRLISAGGHNLASAEAAVYSGDADLVAFGRLFVSNPDLPRRFAVGVPLTAYDRSTFYGGDERGYTDYPFLESVEQFTTAGESALALCCSGQDQKRQGGANM